MRRVPDSKAIQRWGMASGPRVVSAICVILAVVNGVSVALNSRQLHRAGLLLVRTPARTGAATGDARAAQIIGPLLVAHLFGQAPARSAPGAAATVPMEMKLNGTLAAEAGGGSAIISTESKRGGAAAHLYGVGSEITPGFMLSEVFADHVVVLHDDATLVLRLPQFAGGAGPRRIAALLADPRETDAATAASQTDHDFDPPPLPTSGAVLRSLGLRPAVVRGERIGMRVGSGSEGAKTRARLGLSAGDILVDINGDSVSSLPGGGPGALMKAINDGETATLTVQRQGQLINISIDPATADSAANIFRGAP